MWGNEEQKAGNMAVKDKSNTEIDALVGTRDALTGALVVGSGVTPWFYAVTAGLVNLATASAGWVQVRQDDASATTARVMAGMVTIQGTILSYAGGMVDLAALAPGTACIWIYNSGGTATIGTGVAWPATSHIKLASVTLDATPAITGITDWRPAAALTDASSAGTGSQTFTINSGNFGGSDKLQIWAASISSGGPYTAQLALPGGLPGNVTIYLPKGGTLATLAGAETLTNKTLAATLSASFTVGAGAPATLLTFDTAGTSGNHSLAIKAPTLGASTTLQIPDPGISGGTFVVTADGTVGALALSAALADALPTYALAITAQGSTSTPSTITITRKDLQGNTLAGTAFLRVRVCDSGAFANAANATIAAGTGTAAVETLTAGKDLVLQSASDGSWQITLTDVTAETMTLRIGPATLSAERGDWTPTLDVTHA